MGRLAQRRLLEPLDGHCHSSLSNLGRGWGVRQLKEEQELGPGAGQVLCSGNSMCLGPEQRECMGCLKSAPVILKWKVQWAKVERLAEAKRWLVFCQGLRRFDRRERSDWLREESGGYAARLRGAGPEVILLAQAGANHPWSRTGPWGQVARVWGILRR